METTSEKFISRTELIKMLKISPTTMQKYIKARRLPFYRISRKILFKESEVLRAIRYENYEI